MVLKEKRWVVLSEDGRHVSLGRETDPSEEEIRRAEQALEANGLAGWLCILAGSYYSPSEVCELMQVRTLAQPSIIWAESVRLFHQRRLEALQQS